MLATLLHPACSNYLMSNVQPALSDAPIQIAPHTALDVQGILTGTLFVALSLVFFRSSGLLPGGIAGLSFLFHYASGWSLGAAVFALNLPFYVFAYRAMGRVFTVKTFCAVAMVAIYTEVLPLLISFATLNAAFSAVIGGLLAGTGILILIRHGASLGGLGVLAIYLQQRKGWRAGTVQMLCDLAILGLALLVVAPEKVLLSILAAVALKLRNRNQPPT